MQKKPLFRIMALVVSLLLLLSSFAMAKTNDSINNDDANFIKNSNEVLVFQAEEVTDDVQLYERAVNGITEVDIKVKPTANLTKDGDDVSNGKIKTYYTVQKLQTKKDLMTGKTTTRYRQDSYALVPSSLLKDTSKTGKGSSFHIALSDPGQGYDSTYSVMAQTTAYYDLINCYHSGVYINYYRYYQVSGSWTRLDSQVTWSNAQLGAYHQGTGVDTSCVKHGGCIYPTGYITVSSNPTSGSPYSIYVSPPYYYSNSGSLDQNNVVSVSAIRKSPKADGIACPELAGYNDHITVKEKGCLRCA